MTTRNLGGSAKHRSFGLPLALALCFCFHSSARAGAPQRDSDKPYALIFGTVWGPDDRPVYGVRVKIRRATDKPKKVRWELFSDHHGEFAQRVPAGEADYVIWADLKGYKPADGKPLHAQEVTVHVYSEEREDTGLHLVH